MLSNSIINNQKGNQDSSMEMTNKSNSYNLLTHPVISHQLTHLRNKNTPPTVFRTAMNQLSKILAYESTKDLNCSDVKIDTPMEDNTTTQVIDDEVVLVSIMRAGNGLLDGYLQMLPFAKVGHIGIYRDKFINNTVEYYFKLPPLKDNSVVYLLDPMIATGDTSVAAIDRLIEYGAKKIKIISILVSKKSLDRIQKLHPQVELYTLSIERDLDSNGYLLPGIGDAGDRFYGTL
jgi:uracil phosphoribosyltransferase